MPLLTRKDFGLNPHAGAARNNAESRGWGPGWPNCQSHKMATAKGGGVRVSVRHELVPLVTPLLDLTAARGYKLKTGQCWGFACRAIRGTNEPSNHSWGLAIDVDSLTNPMQSQFRTDIPPAVVADWEACGFYWGGRYEHRVDAMHFEYIGRPADVAAHAAHAKERLARLKRRKAGRRVAAVVVVAVGTAAGGVAVNPGAPKPKPAVTAKPHPTKAKALRVTKLSGRVHPGAHAAQVRDVRAVLVHDGFGPIADSPSDFYGATTRAAVHHFLTVHPEFGPANDKLGPRGWRWLQIKAGRKP